MATKQEHRYCKHCQSVMPATRKSASHVGHIVMTLITGGFWLIIWLLAIIFCNKDFKCVKCNNSI